MDTVNEKKRIANEKRLKAVQEWQKNRNQQSNVKAVHQNFVTPTIAKKDKKENKLDLFHSDDEDDNDELSFNIRPQFEGQGGQQLLEKSSEYSDRFKLDERFKLDDDESIEATTENEEKVKNMKILESVLGLEVSERYPEEKSLMKKRNIMRFDPEDENASKYLKTDETLEKKPKKKIRKEAEKTIEEDSRDPIPISTERYIEVNTNLKEILKSASSSQFSLSATFNFNNQDVVAKNEGSFHTPFSTSEDAPQRESKNKFADRSNNIPKKPLNISENNKKFSFFILKDDIRLKEGIEFFQRPKPIEEIRVEWDKTKDEILDLLRRKRKASQRGYVTRPNASQRNKRFSKNKRF